MSNIVGTVVQFAGNYIPDGYVLCDGAILEIDQYPELFSVLSNSLGGNGTTTFKIPDLRPFNLTITVMSPNNTISSAVGIPRYVRRDYNADEIKNYICTQGTVLPRPSTT